MGSLRRTYDLSFSEVMLTHYSSRHQYALTFGGFLLLFAALSDHIGPRPVFTFGMLWLGAWSLGTSFAKDPVLLIVGRAMQGLGAAATVPSAIGTIGFVFEGQAQSQAMACFGAGGSVG
jgi:MFS family permease